MLFFPSENSYGKWKIKFMTIKEHFVPSTTAGLNTRVNKWAHSFNKHELNSSALLFGSWTRLRGTVKTLIRNNVFKKTCRDIASQLDDIITSFNRTANIIWVSVKWDEANKGKVTATFSSVDISGYILTCRVRSSAPSSRASVLGMIKRRRALRFQCVTVNIIPVSNVSFYSSPIVGSYQLSPRPTRLSP